MYSTRKCVCFVVGILWIVALIVSKIEAKPDAVFIVYGIGSFLSFSLSAFYAVKEKKQEKESSERLHQKDRRKKDEKNN